MLTQGKDPKLFGSHGKLKLSDVNGLDMDGSTKLVDGGGWMWMDVHLT